MADDKCVYDLWLLLFIFLLALAFKLLHLFAIPTVAKCFRFLYRQSREDRDKLRQLREMTLEKSKLNMTDNFAKYSKLERQMKKLEAELQTNSTGRSTKSFAVRVGLSIGLKMVQVIVCVGVVLYVKRCYLNVRIESVMALLPEWMRYEFVATPPLWAILPFWMAGCHYFLSVAVDYCASE